MTIVQRVSGPNFTKDGKTMTVEEELRSLKTALRRWSASTDYKQACHHWAELKRLMNLHITPTTNKDGEAE